MRFSILLTGASVLIIKGGNYRLKGEMTQEEVELDSEKKKKRQHKHIKTGTFSVNRMDIIWRENINCIRRKVQE